MTMTATASMEKNAENWDEVERLGSVDAYAAAKDISRSEAKVQILKLYNATWQDADRTSRDEEDRDFRLSDSEVRRLLGPQKSNATITKSKKGFCHKFRLARTMASQYQTIFRFALSYARRIQRKSPNRQILPAEICEHSLQSDQKAAHDDPMKPR